MLHAGATRRVDLHFYEPARDGRLRYGSLAAPFHLDPDDLAGRGEVGGTTVRCERPEFALSNHTGYEPRAVDRHDVARLCATFGLG